MTYTHNNQSGSSLTQSNVTFTHLVKFISSKKNYTLHSACRHPDIWSVVEDQNNEIDMGKRKLPHINFNNRATESSPVCARVILHPVWR